MMKPRERIISAMKHQETDRPPYFEIWIDAITEEYRQLDLPTTHVMLGQDSIMMPTITPANSNQWKTGVDEWGRVWKNGMYFSGVVDHEDDLKKYSTSSEYAKEFFNPNEIQIAKEKYPDHLLMFGSHLGPFMGAYMAMGFEKFFLRIMDEPKFVHKIIEDRTEWAIAMFRESINQGAEILIMGEDAAYKKSPMISTKMWREFVYPYHKRIVAQLDRPVIFHSDGNILPVLPMIIDAGFVGYHSMEPAAGIKLEDVKREYGKDLVLIGNVDVGILAGDNLQAVRDDVDRCLRHGTPGGGYMLATCNSIFKGLNPASVNEFFQYEMKLAQEKITGNIA